MTTLETVAQRLEDMHADVRELKQHVFIGAPGHPSIREDIAILKMRVPKSEPPNKIPSTVWKGVTALLLAIATLVGSYAGVKQLSQSDPEPPQEIVVAK